jgi:hypothetical protein
MHYTLNSCTIHCTHTLYTVLIHYTLHRYHATNADGVFVIDARVGPTVEDSRLIATGDDALVIKTFAGRCAHSTPSNAHSTPGNAHSTPSNAHSTPSNAHSAPAMPTSYTLTNMPSPKIGDVLMVWNPTNISGLPTARGVVASVTGESFNFTVAFTHPLDGIECDPHLEWANDNKTGPGFRYRNNVISSRRFGVLCMGRDGLIEGNRFLDNPSVSGRRSHSYTLASIITISRTKHRVLLAECCNRPRTPALAALAVAVCSCARMSSH